METAQIKMFIVSHKYLPGPHGPRFVLAAGARNEDSCGLAGKDSAAHCLSPGTVGSSPRTVLVKPFVFKSLFVYRERVRAHGGGAEGDLQGLKQTPR